MKWKSRLELVVLYEYMSEHTASYPNTPHCTSSRTYVRFLCPGPDRGRFRFGSPATEWCWYDELQPVDMVMSACL